MSEAFQNADPQTLDRIQRAIDEITALTTDTARSSGVTGTHRGKRARTALGIDAETTAPSVAGVEHESTTVVQLAATPVSPATSSPSPG